jgi:Predicted membrane protein
LAVVILDRISLDVNLPFDAHIFALLSALVNSTVAVLLVIGLIAIKQRKWTIHKNVMLLAMGLSVLFLVFYIAHHLFSGETKFGDINHDGLLSPEEKDLAGVTRYIYYFIISSHILLAGIVMPFVLYSAYRGLTGEYARHKKLVKFTFPIWLYVAVTGVIVYVMISPYYN